MADAALRRHDLVRVDPAAWAALLAGRPDLAEVDGLAVWAKRRHPLVVRRRTVLDPAGQVALGLPLPPNLGKRRIALATERSAILEVCRFPALRAIVGAAPASWQSTVEAVLRLAGTVGIEPLVFGSLAWSVLTGLDYLGTDSDLDLLWPIGWGQDVSDLLEGLQRMESAAPVRLDGEILDPQGRGVNWRELAAGAPEILVKSLASVELVPARHFACSRAAA